MIWNIIWGSLQLLLIVFSQLQKQDEETKKKKEDLHEQAAEAIKSGDKSRITSVLDQLRK